MLTFFVSRSIRPFILVAALLALTTPCSAQIPNGPGQNRSGQNGSDSSGLGSLSVGIIEQTIAVPFKPVSVYALVDFGNNNIKQIPGVFVPFPNQGSNAAAGDRVAVAAVIQNERQTESTEAAGVKSYGNSSAPQNDHHFRFTFFLASLEGEFAATEVTETTWEQIQSIPHTVDAISAAIATAKKAIPQQKERNAATDKKFASLRTQASQIAQVDDLLDLKTELESLKETDEKKVGEVEHIRAAIRRGYAPTVVATSSPTAQAAPAFTSWCRAPPPRTRATRSASSCSVAGNISLSPGSASQIPRPMYCRPMRQHSNVCTPRSTRPSKSARASPPRLL